MGKDDFSAVKENWAYNWLDLSILNLLTFCSKVLFFEEYRSQRGTWGSPEITAHLQTTQITSTGTHRCFQG